MPVLHLILYLIILHLRNLAEGSTHLDEITEHENTGLIWLTGEMIILADKTHQTPEGSQVPSLQ